MTPSSTANSPGCEARGERSRMMTLLDAVAEAFTKGTQEAFDKLAEVVATPAAEMLDKWRNDMMDSAGRDAEVMTFKQWRKVWGS